MSYTRYKNPDGSLVSGSIIRSSDGTCIPFAQGNSECTRFLIEWKAGATVTNADGSAWTYSDAAVVALGLTPLA